MNERLTGSKRVNLILAHDGLFFVAWAAFGFILSVRRTPAILYALMLSTSATPVFGLAVLQAILGPTATGAVGLVALSINLVVPATVVLLEVDAAKRRRAGNITR
jgi:malonate transporter